MRGTTYTPISTVRTASAADITTVSTHTPPAGTSAFLISVETTSARVTFDGTNPGTAGTAPSHVIPKDQMPQLFLMGAEGMSVKWVSTAAAVSLVQITWLR